MISALSAYSPYSTYGAYGSSNPSRASQTRNADKSQSAQRSLVATAQKVHQPETPVQPVTPVRAINSQEDPAQAGLLRFNSDPAEMAVRMRIQYPEDSAQQANEAQAAALSNAGDDTAQAAVLPGVKDDSAQQGNAAQAPVLPGAEDDSAQMTNTAQAVGADKAEAEAPAAAGLKDDSAENPAVEESKSAQEVMEEGECQTCEERKYQDGSDDPGVSFKTPTHISPDQAAAAVRGHENEHVVREQAEAQREDRKVVSQSVTYHTDICPECGKTYVSGGTTRTVTKADDSQQAEQQNQQSQQAQQTQQNQQGRQVQQDPRVPFAAVA